ncbi:MAG: lytic transglycosylase F [Pseudomonadales bacterium]|nr:lytic transglycosylase F [Pseudomonadales bacterium]
MIRSCRTLKYLLLITLVGACSDSAPESSADSATKAAAPSSTMPDSEPIPDVVVVLESEVKIPETEPRQFETGIFENTWTGDLNAMEEHRVIRVLTVYGVGRYYLDGPQEKGLTYELLRRFEEFINKRLERGHLRLHVVFLPVARNQLLPALLEGRGDIAVAGLTITPERSETIDFSIPYSNPVTEVLVTGPAAPELATIDDLSGQTLYVRPSSSYRESVEQLNQRFFKEGKPLVKLQPISEQLEDDDLIEMVNAGLLPWAIVDNYKTQLWDGVFNELVVRDDIVFRLGARLAWAFRKDSPLLEEAANDFLKKNRQGTLIGNILVNRYLRDFDWATNALAPRQFKRFERLGGLFTSYGEQYGIDYLLAAAQGFQESRLDQSVLSPAGAIGIMQLLPSTAADRKVGIPDIGEEEPNIHAGIKYLSYLRNRYFHDSQIDPQNQTLMALAAYNAGPARMINLRAKAQKMGYDPNVWFDNVEIIASKEIGRETVQYVANIYKYYIAYRLTAEQQLQRQAVRLKAGVE